MERNSLSSELKGHRLGGRGMIENKKLVRDLWDGSSSTDHSSSPGGGRDLLGGISWPPRSYTCSFCKREFRSAQALGGHMNVHRRDKARLRQSPPRDAAHHYPFLSLNLHPNANSNPNPNPNPNTDSNPNFTSATRFPAIASTLPPLLSPSLSTLSSSSSASASPSETKKWFVNSVPIDGLSKEATDLTEMKNSKALFGAGEFKGLTKEAECKVFELEQDPEVVRLDLEIDLLSESKADLDLELRLGY